MKDHELSKPSEEKPTGPVRQHHRLATGEKVTGTSNPNGAPPDTTKKIGNADCTH